MVTADLEENTMELTADQTKKRRSEKLPGKKVYKRQIYEKSKCKSWLCLLVHSQELKKPDVTVKLGNQFLYCFHKHRPGMFHACQVNQSSMPLC